MKTAPDFVDLLRVQTELSAQVVLVAIGSTSSRRGDVAATDLCHLLSGYLCPAVFCAGGLTALRNLVRDVDFVISKEEVRWIDTWRVVAVMEDPVSTGVSMGEAPRKPVRPCLAGRPAEDSVPLTACTTTPDPAAVLVD